MTFSQILQELDKLKIALENNPALPLIEQDILKNKLSELYLLLSKGVDTPQGRSNYNEPVVQPPHQPPLRESTPPEPVSAPTKPAPAEPMPPKKDTGVDYRTLADVFLEKDTPPKQGFKEDNTLLSKISQARITDLKRAIAMNDRFIFIKELFRNDFEAYNRCINHLNEYTEAEKARDYLASLQTDYQWDEQNDVVKHFVSIVQRKFL